MSDKITRARVVDIPAHDLICLAGGKSKELLITYCDQEIIIRRSAPTTIFHIENSFAETALAVYLKMRETFMECYARL